MGYQEPEGATDMSKAITIDPVMQTVEIVEGDWSMRGIASFIGVLESEVTAIPYRRSDTIGTYKLYADDSGFQRRNPYCLSLPNARRLAGKLVIAEGVNPQGKSLPLNGHDLESMKRYLEKKVSWFTMRLN